MRKNKWNYVNRYQLFANIVERFGAHAEWPKESRPANAEEYEAFLREFAETVQEENGNNTTVAAIKQQIAWAITKQPRLWKPIQLRNYILNKAAALETGFIETKNLPYWAELENPHET